VAPKLKPETLEQRKEQILKAALTCFADKGYHQTTMDDIVEEAGISKGGVYWYFDSKKELFLEMFAYVVGDIEGMMQATPLVGGSAKEALVAVLHNFAALTPAEDVQEMMWLLIDVWAHNRQDTEVNEVAMGMYEHFRQPIAEIIEVGIASGEFKRVDATALGGIIVAIFDGLMVQWMIDERIVDWEGTVETLVETLVAGLLAKESG
jgi:AcrR family transcriptional regulator